MRPVRLGLPTLAIALAYGASCIVGGSPDHSDSWPCVPRRVDVCGYEVEAGADFVKQTTTRGGGCDGETTTITTVRIDGLPTLFCDDGDRCEAQTAAPSDLRLEGLDAVIGEEIVAWCGTDGCEVDVRRSCTGDDCGDVADRLGIAMVSCHETESVRVETCYAEDTARDTGGGDTVDTAIDDTDTDVGDTDTDVGDTGTGDTDDTDTADSDTDTDAA